MTAKELIIDMAVTAIKEKNPERQRTFEEIIETAIQQYDGHVSEELEKHEQALNLISQLEPKNPEDFGKEYAEGHNDLLETINSIITTVANKGG